MMIDIARERSYSTPYANSSFLNMLLISLAVQKHTPDTKNYIQEEYDYIVVGAGAGGSVVASRLSEVPCVTVLLLEAGKSPPILTDIPAIASSFIKSDIDWKYESAPQKQARPVNRTVYWPSGKAIGGSTVINTMLNVRGNCRNFDGWARQGAIGWSYDGVLPYFKKLESDPAHFIRNPWYHGLTGPIIEEVPRYNFKFRKAVLNAAEILGYPIIDNNGPFQNGFAYFTSTTNVGQRVSTGKAYLVPAENRTNLDIVAETLVTKVLIENRRAFGVEIERGGKRYQIRARREVILSAGTVNTAQLLLLSGIGPKDHLREMNISLVANLPVGLNFQDQSGVEMSYRITGKSYLRKLLDFHNILNYVSYRKGPLCSPNSVSNIASLTNHKAPPYALPDHGLYIFEAGYSLDPGNSTLVECGSMTLNPKSRGSVKLSSPDIHDPPVIDPNYFQVEQDLIDLVEGMKHCDIVMKQKPLQELNIQPLPLHPECAPFIFDKNAYYTCHARFAFRSASHQVGTARMGDPRDSRTVVDPKLRVLRVKGLRVVDASVMPTVTSGNTYIPTVMIGEKGSDIIKQSIQCLNIYGN